MTLILCVDNSGGVSFFNKRLSKDRRVEADMKEMVGSSNLYAHPYSQSFFLEPGPGFIFDTAYREKASDEDYVFYEIGDIEQKRFDTVIVYCWNRNYPRESIFQIDHGFQLVSEEIFPGYSHEKITKKIYKR
ncbi:MAG: hypothetical protein ACI39H_00025 [Lachnospiraceae bacterium]